MSHQDRHSASAGIGALFGVSASEISLTRNASEALHLQTVGLNLERGDEAIITSQEHPAGNRPWMVRKARDGISVREVFIPSQFSTGDDVVERLEAAITPRTRVDHLREVRPRRGPVRHNDGTNGTDPHSEHQRDGHNAIRVSTHMYNTRDEIDRLTEAIAAASR